MHTKRIQRKFSSKGDIFEATISVATPSVIESEISFQNSKYLLGSSRPHLHREQGKVGYVESTNAPRYSCYYCCLKIPDFRYIGVHPAAYFSSHEKLRANLHIVCGPSVLPKPGRDTGEILERYWREIPSNSLVERFILVAGKLCPGSPSQPSDHYRHLRAYSRQMTNSTPLPQSVHPTITMEF